MNTSNSSVTLQSWNQLADLYLEKFGEIHLYDSGYDEFCRRLPEGNARLLELGCGPGNLTRALLLRRPDVQILGLDAAPEMLRLARQHVPAAHFEVADVRNLSAYPGPFDGIVSGFCIPYLQPEELRLHLADCASRLRMNGILYISFVEGDPLRSGWVRGSTGLEMEFYYFQKPFLRDLLMANGLVLEVEMDFSFPRETDVEIHSLFLARKC